MIDVHVLCSCICCMHIIIYVNAAVQVIASGSCLIAIGLVATALEYHIKIIFIERVKGLANSYVRNVEFVVDLSADR